MGSEDGDKSKRRRGRRPSAGADRKDRVIQTRVPRDLESTLKDVADRERVSVSHLIRNVLEDTFNLVDNIVADSATLVSTVRRDARRIAASARANRAPSAPDAPAQSPAGAQASRLDEVEAWQEVIVNRGGVCAQCGAELRRGQKAFRGLSSNTGAPAPWLCESCIRSL